MKAQCIGHTVFEDPCKKNSQAIKLKTINKRKHMKKLIKICVLLIMMIGGIQLVHGQTVTIVTNPTPPTICPGTLISLTAQTSGGIVQSRVWTDNFGGNYGGTASINVTPGTTTTYTVTVTFVGPIVRVASQTVTVLTAPTAAITAGGPTSFCQGDSVVLNSSVGGGVIAYQWRLGGSDILGANGATYSAKVSGAYTLVVSNGPCSATSNVINVTVSAAPTIGNVTFSSPCADGDMTVTIDGLTGPYPQNIYIYDDGTGPGNLVHTQSVSTSSTSYTIHYWATNGDNSNLYIKVTRPSTGCSIWK